MRRTVAFALLATAVLAVAASGAAKKLPAPITLSGVSGVVPGMSRAEVQRRWSTPVRFYESPPSPDCDQADIKAGAVRGYAIFFKKKFNAVFFYGGMKTAEGIHIGSTVADVKKAYGSRLHSEPDKYLAKGSKNHYVRGSRYELRIDTSAKGRVTQIAFGDSAVHLVEGCL